MIFTSRYEGLREINGFTDARDEINSLILLVTAYTSSQFCESRNFTSNLYLLSCYLHMC